MSAMAMPMPLEKSVTELKEFADTLRRDNPYLSAFVKVFIGLMHSEIKGVVYYTSPAAIPPDLNRPIVSLPSNIINSELSFYIGRPHMDGVDGDIEATLVRGSLRELVKNGSNYRLADNPQMSIFLNHGEKNISFSHRLPNHPVEAPGLEDFSLAKYGAVLMVDSQTEDGIVVLAYKERSLVKAATAIARALTSECPELTLVAPITLH